MILGQEKGNKRKLTLDDQISTAFFWRVAIDVDSISKILRDHIKRSNILNGIDTSERRV